MPAAMSEQRVIDSDGHVIEPPELWTEYVEPAYRDRTPQVVTNARGETRSWGWAAIAMDIPGGTRSASYGENRGLGELGREPRSARMGTLQGGWDPARASGRHGRRRDRRRGPLPDRDARRAPRSQPSSRRCAAPTTTGCATTAPRIPARLLRGRASCRSRTSRMAIRESAALRPRAGLQGDHDPPGAVHRRAQAATTRLTIRSGRSSRISACRSPCTPCRFGDLPNSLPRAAPRRGHDLRQRGAVPAPGPHQRARRDGRDGLVRRRRHLRALPAPQGRAARGLRAAGRPRCSSAWTTTSTSSGASTRRRPPTELFAAQLAGSASIPTRCALPFTAEQLGAERILWASDYPHPDAKIPGRRRAELRGAVAKPRGHRSGPRSWAAAARVALRPLDALRSLPETGYRAADLSACSATISRRQTSALDLAVEQPADRRRGTERRCRAPRRARANIRVARTPSATITISPSACSRVWPRPSFSPSVRDCGRGARWR